MSEEKREREREGKTSLQRIEKNQHRPAAVAVEDGSAGPVVQRKIRRCLRTTRIYPTHLHLPRGAVLMAGALVRSRISIQQEVREGSRQTRERESGEKNANGGGGATVALRLQRHGPSPFGRSLHQISEFVTGAAAQTCSARSSAKEGPSGLE